MAWPKIKALVLQSHLQPPSIGVISKHKSFLIAHHILFRETEDHRKPVLPRESLWHWSLKTQNPQPELEAPLNCECVTAYVLLTNLDNYKYKLCCLERTIASNFTLLCFINLYVTMRKPLYVLSVLIIFFYGLSFIWVYAPSPSEYWKTKYFPLKIIKSNWTQVFKVIQVKRCLTNIEIGKYHTLVNYQCPKWTVSMATWRKKCMIGQLASWSIE